MIIKRMIEMVEGSLHIVELILYSNGILIKRVLDKDGLPQSVEKL
jgi:hypothetical protein